MTNSSEQGQFILLKHNVILKLDNHNIPYLVKPYFQKRLNNKNFKRHEYIDLKDFYSQYYGYKDI
jgi:hypothetical protein